jgi:hypothetical protein
MFKTLMLTLLVLISAVCLLAEPAGPSDKSQKSADPTMIQGCLKVSSGQYFLTEDEGKVHLLAGAAKKLSPEVGHEVEVGGTPGTRTEDTTSVGGGSSANEFVVFEVKTVKHISDTCQSAAHGRSQ